MLELWHDLDTTDKFLLAILDLFGFTLVILKFGGYLTVPWWLALMPWALLLGAAGLLVGVRIAWDRLCRFVGDD